MEDIGVSMLKSSLMPDELPWGTRSGGGVLILRSSNWFQKFKPAEFLEAWCEKVLEDRLLADSLPIVTSSGMSSRPSTCPAVARMLGEDAVVLG